MKRYWMIGLAILVVIAGYFMMQEKPAPQAPKETPKQEAPAPKPAETPKPAEAPKAEEKPAETPKPAEAPKAEEKPAEEPKPEEKPAEAPKAEEKPAEPAKTEEPKAAVEPVKVGYLAALTGDWAAYGQTEEKTARLAVKEINDKGGVLGRPLELVVYDFRTRAEDAVNAVRRMIEEDKVVAIVGANGSGINIATAPIVNRLGVSQVGTVSTNPLVTVDEKGAVRPYSFRICFTDPYQGKLIAFFAASELKKMNAAILYDVGNDYSQGLREFFMKSYGEYGGKVVADLGFRGGQDVDFRAQLTEIREKGADVLVLPNMGKEMALIMKQARELGLKDIVFVGGDGYGEFMWEIAGDAMEGSYWINHVAPEDPAMQPFFTSYREMWNDECKEFVNGVLGYDSVYWVADAISRAGSDDPKAIRDALEATKDLKLHHATITMDPATHNPVDKDGVVLIAKGGKGQFFTKIKPTDEVKPAEEPKPAEKPAEAPKAEEKPVEAVAAAVEAVAEKAVEAVAAAKPEAAAAVSAVAAAVAPKEPVKVGYLAALTGDWAAYGQTEEKTARLAVKEINDKGGVLGRPLELVVYDFRTRAEDAVNAVRRMIEEDKVVAIVGANGSGINIATAPIVNRLGVSQVGTVSTNPLVTVDEKGAVRPYSFRICFTDPYQGKLIAFFAASELKKMNAAILYDVGNDYSQGLREFFMKSYGEYGGKVVADLGFRGGQDVDFRAQLTEIREKGADVLVLPNMGKEMALIMKQARELGLKDIVFVGGDGYGEFMWEIAGDAMEGSYWINHVAPEDPAMQPFFTSYREMWNDECKEFVNGVLGYDSVYWVADAISRAGSDDPKAIRDALEATKDLKLHHATITMDPATHNPVDKDGVVLIAKDGKGQFFTKIKP